MSEQLKITAADQIAFEQTICDAEKVRKLRELSDGFENDFAHFKTRVEELEKKLNASLEIQHGEKKILIAEIESHTLTKQRAERLEGWIKYVSHRPSCPKSENPFNSLCTCGLDELRANLSPKE